MSARSSARVTVMLLAAGAAPAAGAAELGQMPAALEAAANASAAISFPIFLDASRFAYMQAAWRSRVDVELSDKAVSVVTSSVDPEADTINGALRTLTRGEEVNRKAAEIRERAEELSRRFAISTPEERAPAVPASLVPDANIAEAPQSAAAPVAETASIEPADATADVFATVQKAAVVGNPIAGDMAPASMLGGPRTEKVSPEDAAPVIEDMATKAVTPVKRTSALHAKAAQQKLAREAYEVAPPATVAKPDAHAPMPTELRAFGWASQP